MAQQGAGGRLDLQGGNEQVHVGCPGLPTPARVAPCVCALVGDCAGEAIGRELHVGMDLVCVVPYYMSCARDGACHIAGTHLLHTSCMNTTSTPERTRACVGTSHVSGQRQTGTHVGAGGTRMHGCVQTQVSRTVYDCVCGPVSSAGCATGCEASGTRACAGPGPPTCGGC